jgi:hypothetical protein
MALSYGQRKRALILLRRALRARLAAPFAATTNDYQRLAGTIPAAATCCGI